jgi:hypothetical protein
MSRKAPTLPRTWPAAPPERTDVAEKLAGDAVAAHHVHLVIANLDAGAGHHLHRQLVGRQFLAVPEDPEVVGQLVGRGRERSVAPDRYVEDFAQVGVVGNAPTLRVGGNGDPHRHDVQNGLHLIDPTPQLLIEATDLLLGPLPARNVQVPPLEEAERPVRGEHPVAARPDPPDRAVPVPDAVLDVVHPPLPQGGDDGLAGRRPVLGQHDVVVVDPAGNELVGRVAGHVFDALADDQGRPVLVGQGPVRRPRKESQERVEQPLALPQRLLGLTEVVDVLDCQVQVVRKVPIRTAVGVSHGTDRLVTNSYNDQRLSASSRCAGACVAWPTCS